MLLPVAKIPDDTAKSGKTMSQWPPKVKAGLILLACAVLLYLLLCIKTLYLKNERLNRVSNMANNADIMMHNLHILDEDLSIKLSRLKTLQLTEVTHE